MRNFADQDEFATSGVTLPILLGLPAAEPPPPPAPQADAHDQRPPARRDGVRAVEVIRNGTDHETFNFSRNGRIRALSAPAAPPPSDGAAAGQTVPPAGP
jgi:hypothetical protein